MIKKVKYISYLILLMCLVVANFFSKDLIKQIINMILEFQSEEDQKKVCKNIDEHGYSYKIL